MNDVPSNGCLISTVSHALTDTANHLSCQPLSCLDVVYLMTNCIHRRVVEEIDKTNRELFSPTMNILIHQMVAEKKIQKK